MSSIIVGKLQESICDSNGIVLCLDYSGGNWNCDKCQNSVKIHNKLWHLCFKFVFISY